MCVSTVTVLLAKHLKVMLVKRSPVKVRQIGVTSYFVCLSVCLSLSVSVSVSVCVCLSVSVSRSLSPHTTSHFSVLMLLQLLHVCSAIANALAKRRKLLSLIGLSAQILCHVLIPLPHIRCLAGGAAYGYSSQSLFFSGSCLPTAPTSRQQPSPAECAR